MAAANPLPLSDEIIKTLNSFLGKPQTALALDKNLPDMLDKVKCSVIEIRNLLTDPTMKTRRNLRLTNWLEDVEDVLRNVNELLNLLQKSSISLFFRIILSRSKQFLGRLEAIPKQLEVLRSSAGQLVVDPSFEKDDEAVFGRKYDEETLRQLLLGSWNDEPVSVVSIVGMRGLGKTRLAKLVFCNEKVKTHFVLKPWVNVSGDFDLKKIASDISRSLDNPEIEIEPEKQVEGRRFLLVLDDVQNVDPDTWLGFKRLLMVGAEGSRVLITTRSREVATTTATTPPYELTGLSMVRSLEFFKHVVFYNRNFVSREEVEELATKIVGSCNDSKNRDMFEILAKKVVEKCNDPKKKKVFGDLAKEIVCKRIESENREIIGEHAKVDANKCDDSKKKEVLRVHAAKEDADKCDDLKRKEVLGKLATKEVADKCDDSKKKEVVGEHAKEDADKCDDSKKKELFGEIAAKDDADKYDDSKKKEVLGEHVQEDADNCDDLKKKELFGEIAAEEDADKYDSKKKEVLGEHAKADADKCDDSKKKELFGEIAAEENADKYDDLKKKEVLGEHAKEDADKCDDSKKKELFGEIAAEEDADKYDSKKKEVLGEHAKEDADKCDDLKKKELFGEIAAEENADKYDDSKKKEVLGEHAKEDADKCDDLKKKELFGEIAAEEDADKYDDSKKKEVLGEHAKENADKCYDSKKKELFGEIVVEEDADKYDDLKEKEVLGEHAKEDADRSDDSKKKEMYGEIVAEEDAEKYDDLKKKEVLGEHAKEDADKCDNSKKNELFREIAAEEDADNYDDSKKKEVLGEHAKEDADKFDDSKKKEVFEKLAKKIVDKCNDSKKREVLGEFAKEIVDKCKDSETGNVFEELVQKCNDLKIREVFEELAVEIVVKCSGNPLTIKTIGNILRSKNTDEWSSFKDYQLHQLTRQDGDIDIPPELNLSYKELPVHLQDCFAYCSLFPIDHEIDVSTLIQFWVAQDFVKNDDPSKTLEEIGDQSFEKLVEISFLEKVETTGNATKGKMYDHSHVDLARYEAGKKYIKLDLNDQNSVDSKRTLHVSFDFPLSSLKQIPTFWRSAKRIQSLVRFPQQQRGEYEESSNQAIFDAIVSNLKSLRTLDLHYSGIKSVPRYIDSLKELRYLDLSRNPKIKVLPHSITKLLNLQTLKLSLCFRLQELPRDIKKLVNLRHLQIDGCYNLTHMPSGMGELRDLQTLSQFVLSKEANSVSGHCGKLSELRELNNLRGDLQIRNLRHDHDFKDICLKEKQRLQSLTLQWGAGAMKLDDEKLLEDLSEHENLKRFTFNGYGGAKLPDWLSASRHLVKLELRRCPECKFLPPLHCCDSLEALVLDDMIKLEYIAEKPVANNDFFFRRLIELRLTELPVLKRWWESTNPNIKKVPVFRHLSKLFIEDCPQLISMPLFPYLDEGLVMDNTNWKPFQQTMKKRAKRLPLSKLKNLSIVGLEDLDNNAANAIKWETLTSLQFLRLDFLPSLEYLPKGLKSITSLQELHIWRCNFTAIPEWISELKFLKKLSIWVCPKMKSLPETISSMNSLLTLEIEDCPTLLHRCQTNAGADWDKISRIPDLRLDRMSRK